MLIVAGKLIHSSKIKKNVIWSKQKILTHLNNHDCYYSLEENQEFQAHSYRRWHMQRTHKNIRLLKYTKSINQEEKSATATVG